MMVTDKLVSEKSIRTMWLEKGQFLTLVWVCTKVHSLGVFARTI